MAEIDLMISAIKPTDTVTRIIRSIELHNKWKGKCYHFA